MSLEQRLKRLEDLEEIRDLKHRYAAYCDENYAADSLVELFTDDAVWDGGAMGVCRGRDAIHRYFTAAAGHIPFAIHHVTNSRICVDGDTATGYWYLWQPATYLNEAVWLAAKYEDQYRRVNDKWLFERVTIETTMLSPYDEGWHVTRFVDGAASPDTAVGRSQISPSKHRSDQETVDGQ